ncbi:hypothetical protein SERLA73DRAFT_44444, partial [Serpula lacrymans var. lacrymans S7.3]
REQHIFVDLLKRVPGLERCLMGKASTEEKVIHIADLIQKGANGARSDNTKGIKTTVIDWIMPKGQTLLPHLHCNIRTGCGFNHNYTSALLFSIGLDWSDPETKKKLINGQIQVAGDQWPVMLYANYHYDLKVSWNGLLRSICILFSM